MYTLNVSEFNIFILYLYEYTEYAYLCVVLYLKLKIQITYIQPMSKNSNCEFLDMMYNGP